MNVDQDVLPRAINTALRFINYTPRSVHEVQERLERKGFVSEVIQLTLDTLIKQGLLHDKVFALAWIRSRIGAKHLGKYKVLHELRGKGVSEITILEAFEEMDTEDIHTVVEHGVMLLQVQFAKRSHPPEEHQLLVFLQRKGYDLSASKQILQAWQHK